MDCDADAACKIPIQTTLHVRYTVEVCEDNLNPAVHN